MDPIFGTISKPYGEIDHSPVKVGETFRSNVICSELHKILIGAVLVKGIDICTLPHGIAYSKRGDKSAVELAYSNAVHTVHADLVIAADGTRFRAGTLSMS